MLPINNTDNRRDFGQETRGYSPNDKLKDAAARKAGAPLGNPDEITDKDNTDQTIASITGLSVDQVHSKLSTQPLSAYVGIMDAIKSGDHDKIKQIMGATSAKQQDVLGEPEQEPNHGEMTGMTEDMAPTPLDPKQKMDLQKIASQMPKGNNVKTTNMNTNTNTNSNGTNSVGSSGSSPNNNQNSMDQDDEIVGVDSQAGTIAVQSKNPMQQQGQPKIDLKSIKDPQQLADIQQLLKNAGITF